MAGFVQAVAFDLDGTLTSQGGLSEEAIEAIDAMRAAGRSAILVTGRILAELDSELPGLAEHFDAVVGENGAVLRLDGERALAEPVEDSLAEALAGRQVAVRRGSVLLACEAHQAAAVATEIARLGLDCHVLRNRAALMVLPSDVSKGSGLRAALAELGISAHNTIAVGDAENDLALLQAAEVGVAVANAVPSLAQHADVVLDKPDGAGVTALLAGPLLRGEQVIWPARRRTVIGSFEDGTSATGPGAQANVLVCGGTGAGKSYVTGLLVEGWCGAGYSVLVVDMEEDHVGLDQLRGVVVLGQEQLPAAHELLAMVKQRGLSVVLDLSGPSREVALGYLRTIGPALDAGRVADGLPHWVVVDEAHESFGEDAMGPMAMRPVERGYCLVTYQPERLSSAAAASIDVTITVAGPAPPADLFSVAPLATVEKSGGPPRRFSVARRHTPHVRHWHKYAASSLSPTRRFYFSTPRGAPAGVAGTLREFVHRLSDDEVIEYHLARGDFSRWISDSIGDLRLGLDVGAVERELLVRRAAEVRRACQLVSAAIERRYRTAGDA